MEPKELVKDLDLAALFAAGAASALRGMDVSEKQAEAFVSGVCKEAAMGKLAAYDDEDDTFWGRNKGWLLPTILSALAFKIGGDAGRYGRRDRSYLSNAASDIWHRFQGFMGVPKGPMTSALSLPDPDVVKITRKMPKSKPPRMEPDYDSYGRGEEV